MTLIGGLPAHVLLVHAIVVLVPLVALGVVLSALWPVARVRLVWPTLALAVVLLVLTPVTTDAGEWLEQQLGESPRIETHADLGETMPWVVIALFVAALLVAAVHVLIARERIPAARVRIVTVIVAVVAVIIAVGAVVQVYRVGESGSRAVWEGRVPVTSG
ncbi:DUF2231 domain-containing protein [Rhodococcus sp. NPDC003382]